MIEPLRKRTVDGSAYARPTAIETSIAELSELSRDDLIARCEITAKADPHYVRTECILHFVRATRRDNSEAWFERLYKELSRRVLRRLPREQHKGDEAMTAERIRETVLDRFLDLLSIDRCGYCDKLDYFEVAFDSALASLRMDGRRRAWREEKRTAVLDDPVTGQMSAAVEAAAGSYDPFEIDEFDDPVYRKRIDAAIGELPKEQREIVEMLRLGFPIESKDPNTLSIATALNIVEKTVRNRRDRAFASIREKLQGDEA